MKPQQQRSRIASPKAFAHDPRPQSPRRPVLRDLLQQIIVRVKEKLKLRRKIVNIQPTNLRPAASPHTHRHYCQTNISPRRLFRLAPPPPHDQNPPQATGTNRTPPNPPSTP